VSLNETVDARGKVKRQVASPVSSHFGLTYYHGPNSYYRDDIVVRKYKNGKKQNQKPDRFAKKHTVALSTTQEQSWWRLPEGLTKKQQKQQFSFAFGEDEKSPWVWNDAGKRPVLYWEKFEVALTPLTKIEATNEDEAEEEANDEAEETVTEGKYATEGELTPDISWQIEHGTLAVIGEGDIPGSPAWLKVEAISDVTSVLIDDGITSLGHHAFAMSKISSIVIGANVTSLNTYALFNCNNLVLVEVRNATPPKVGAFVFMSTPIGKAKLIVPVGAKAAYTADKNWKKFGTIEERNE
jgi:hypothetical protein